ncbi:MAG TPA: hypothetical protein VLA56_09985 [Pseudomonadales bacterium]|nr:hypothetical protein [Pseudomonadales bacterium]
MQPRPQLFQRYEGNPILVPEQWSHTVNAVFNPGAVRFAGETLLLVRVEDRSGISHLAIARSADGLTHWRIEAEPSLAPVAGSYDEAWGIEDPRITQCGDEYMIVYTGYSRGGPLVRLASTRDFRTFERRGTLMPPDDKDAALFPCRFGGRWALLHRPSGTAAHIWLSWSPDLRHWGDHTTLVHARRGGWWDANRIGLGPPPMLTKYGWLILYHGVRTTAAGSLYRLGLAMLDRDNPARVLVRGNEWIFGPEAEYERRGDVPEVVFPCGWILDDDGRSIRLYYGAADTTVCVAMGDLEEIVAYLYGHCICGRPHEPGDCCAVAAAEPVDVTGENGDVTA